MKILIVALVCLCLVGCEGIEEKPIKNIEANISEEEAYPYYYELKEKGFEITPTQGNQLLGYAIMDDELTAIYYCRGSKKWGDRIAKKSGEYYVYISGLPPLLDTEKVKDFYNSLKMEKK